MQINVMSSEMVERQLFVFVCVCVCELWILLSQIKGESLPAKILYSQVNRVHSPVRQSSFL